jgi:hypothetical protein
LPQDQPRVNLAKAVVRRNTAPIRRPWSKDDVRVLESITRKEPVAKNAKALKRTDGATPQKAIVIEHPQIERTTLAALNSSLQRGSPWPESQRTSKRAQGQVRESPPRKEGLRQAKS